MRQQDTEYKRESMHKREGINWYERRHGVPVKYSAIRGFFRTNVGRPWDKVFSEFCHKYDIRTPVGRYARDAVEWMVEVNPDLDDEGNVLVRYRYSYRDNFYVHPRTGILCKTVTKAWKRPVTPLDQQLVHIQGRYFYKWDDIWYECLWRSLPPKDGADTLANRLAGKHCSYWVNDIFEQSKAYTARYWPHYNSYSAFERHYIERYGEPIYCYSKRQIGKKDIKKVNEYIRKYSKKA